ncbi:DNA translocase FtsK [Roseiconus nitratireducens]|uniref:DNA translocase FtsK n=1 Tax=Roseiconus nitratireducens TaxID=2605748 RepID=A0A5M6DHQ2_9BACT|nr:DNA translocase FtsK [Roseiconus nitratireducens]KAA5547051.1 DNA translocase FtsK [Roseiconus nitratireducens]
MSADLIDESPSPPDFARDIGAILLIALTVLLAVSLVTRDASDPIETPLWPISALHVPDQLVYPPADQISNACGYWGALLASGLTQALGVASAFLVAVSGGVSVALLRRGHVRAPVLRSLGGTITLVGIAGVAAMLPLQIEGMPIVGGGGYLGAMVSTWLLEHFAPLGAWILILTVLAIGLLLTTDYAILYASRKIFAGGAKVSQAGMRRAAGAMPPLLRKRRQPFNDITQPFSNADESAEGSADEEVEFDSADEASEEEESYSEPRIKFRSGKRKRGQGRPTRDQASTSVATVDHDNSAEDVDQGEEAYDEEEFDSDSETDDQPAIREIEVEDETVVLRGDAEHKVAGPKIRLPKKPKGEDELQQLYEDVVENAPAGSEEYQLPRIELLEASDDIDYDEQLSEVRRKAKVLEATFRDFGFNIRVVEIETGPVIAQYEIELEAGLRLSKITGLAEDLAIALRVPSVRIVAPIPGKNTVGIEVPNEKRQVVRLRDVMEESDTRSLKMNIPVFLGKDVSGNPMVVDLAKMPHLLIAGRTGTGKSVCLNAIITSVLMTCRPDEVRMLMIDPKMVELSGYGKLPHLMHPVITDMRKAEAILAWAVEKMEERYSLLANVGVRHINSFNDLGRDEILRRLEVDPDEDDGSVPDRLPFIVIVADEMADLMMTAGKDVEQHIIRLAQKSRAVGIHLILATQKPTVDVITGLIKSNLPARLSFQVASKTDSRVVLDENGADKLLGNGDMLFLWPGTSTLIRGQGTYLSDEEIDSVCAHCGMGEQNFVGELLNLKVADEDGGDGPSIGEERPELYDSAVEVVIREGRGSCSLLQRCMGIGYGRAAKLIDFMAEDGIVGQYNGSKAREVLLTMEQWHEMQGIDPPEIDDPSESTTRQAGSSDDDEAYDEYEDEEEEEEYEDWDE